jgi:GNAT superfamily N-acetyltransferase
MSKSNKEARMSMTIRIAEEGDLPQVLSVYRDAGIDGEEGLALPEARLLFRKMSTYPSYRVYVAVVEGRILGSFALAIMDNLAHGGAPSGLVEDVAVARAAQGRGIGKAMMGFALDECRRQGCYKMALSSNEARTGAHAFYEALGFTRHGFSYLADLGGPTGS